MEPKFLLHQSNTNSEDAYSTKLLALYCFSFLENRADYLSFSFLCLNECINVVATEFV